MNKAIIAAGLTAGLIFGAAAHADHHAEKFAAMDSDGDAVVSLDEFTTYATSEGDVTVEDAELHFAVIAGVDGMLTADELASAMDEAETEAETEVDASLDYDATTTVIAEETVETEDGVGIDTES